MDEIERAARDEIKRIQRDGYLGATSGSRRTKPMLKNDIDEGTYAPDQELVDICLQCKKKQCRTGNCAKIADAKRRRAEANRNA